MPQRHRPLLTPTQWRVLERLAAGEDNAAIAQGFGLALVTVAAHTSAIYQRLSLGGRGRSMLSKRAAAIDWYLTVGQKYRAAVGDDA